MALADLFALVDDKLKDVFHKVTYDPTKDRDKMVKRIDDTKGKFIATEPAKGKKDFSISNGVVEYRPTLPGGGPLVLEKRDVNYVPSERFVDFLTILRAEVAEGRLDKEIEAAATKTTASLTRHAAKTGSDVASTRTYSGNKAGWSDERRERFAASIAARKAAKGK